MQLSKQFLVPESTEEFRRALDQLIVRTVTTHDLGFATKEQIILEDAREELYCRILQVKKYP